MLKKLSFLFLCALLATAVGLASGCGRKGKLYPRDKLDYTDEELPPQWHDLPDQPPAAEIGIDGLLQKSGDPHRLRSRDLTPEPPAAPESTPAEPTPAESETEEDES